MLALDLIIGVDRVASVEEAVAFCNAGATLIGVSLDPDPSFEDTRFVSPSVAKTIQQAIAPARLVGVLPTYFYYPEKAEAHARIERMLALNPDFLHFYRGGLTGELVSLVQAADVPVIRDGAILDADQGVFPDPSDPASFVRKQIEDGTRLDPVLCHLDVLTDMAVDPWIFLNSTAPEQPKNIPQVADITAICRNLPLLLSLMEVGADTIASYVQAFPAARGFFGRLGPGETSGAPCTRPEPLLAALQALKQHRSSTSPTQIVTATA